MNRSYNGGFRLEMVSSKTKVLIFLKLSIDVKNALAPHKVECFGKSEQLEKGILPVLYALAKSQVYCFLLNLLMVRTLSSLLNNYLMSVSPPLSCCDLAESHQIITNHDLNYQKVGLC
jgi:hypothetical protein